jgi:hypothetical protein
MQAKFFEYTYKLAMQAQAYKTAYTIESDELAAAPVNASRLLRMLIFCALRDAIETR